MATNNYYIEGNGYVDSFGRPIFKATELAGDSVFDGSMISSGYLTVIPLGGFALAAADFEVSNSASLTTPFLDDGTESPDYRWIDSIVLTDTGTAYASNNTILITVNFTATGPRGSLTLASDENFLIKLDVDGKVIVDNIVDNIDIDEIIVTEVIDDIENTPDEDGNIIANDGAEVTITEVTPFVYSEDIVDNNTEIGIAGPVKPGESVVIAQVDVDAGPNKFFPETPMLAFAGMPSGILKLQSPVITRDSKNRAIAYKFDVIYKSKKSTKNSPGKAFLRYKTAKTPVVTKEITKVLFGKSHVSSKGDNRQIKIFGDADAEFDLTITKDTDGSCILSNSVANKNILSPEYGKIKAINKQLIPIGRRKGRTSFVFNQEFPDYSESIASSNTASSISGSVLTVDVNSSTANISVGDRLISDDIPNTPKVTVTAINIPSSQFVLSSAVTLLDNALVNFVRPERYHINIFPKSESTIGSQMPLDNPRYTINQYNTVRLTIKTKETDAGFTGPTNTYVYYGKPNSLPSQNFNNPNIFSMVFTMSRTDGSNFTARGSTSGIPGWSSTVDYSDEPTQSTWSNSVPSKNGGTHIEIFNIKVTGVGTTTYTITADVLFKKWGTEEVRMILDLDTLIT
tara:strand:- start:9586 stop:11469 length:1884 start_codon:yes stop_codon:yes gene_type:complete